MELKQLRDLGAVARAQFDRDAVDLKEALTREAELRAALDELADSEEKRARALHGDLQFSFAQTGEALWQAWADARRKDLLARMANQRAVRESIQARARLSFGRQSALSDLARSIEEQQILESEQQAAQEIIALEVNRNWMASPGEDAG